jgi:aspartate aminotransferase
MQCRGGNASYADGAFYVFADFSDCIAAMPDIQDDVGLAEYLLVQAEVAVVPGSAFGNPGYIRFSCAASMANLEEAMQRISSVLA